MKLPPDAIFSLHVPVDDASISAVVSLQRDFHTISVAYVCLKGPRAGLYINVCSGSYLSPDSSLNIYSQLTAEDSYQNVVKGAQRPRVEIVSDALSPPP